MIASPTELTLDAPPKTAMTGAPELCVVMPSFNERENVPVLVARLASRVFYRPRRLISR